VSNDVRIGLVAHHPIFRVGVTEAVHRCPWARRAAGRHCHNTAPKCVNIGPSTAHPVREAPNLSVTTTKGLC
jgi:hypothetical protein